MDKRLFSFLKDRKIFTGGGDKTLREYLTRQEQNREYKDRARINIKKKRRK
jgi:hypothetical protein